MIRNNNEQPRDPQKCLEITTKAPYPVRNRRLRCSECSEHFVVTWHAVAAEVVLCAGCGYAILSSMLEGHLDDHEKRCPECIRRKMEKTKAIQLIGTAVQIIGTAVLTPFIAVAATPALMGFVEFCALGAGLQILGSGTTTVICGGVAAFCGAGKVSGDAVGKRWNQQVAANNGVKIEFKRVSAQDNLAAWSVGCDYMLYMRYISTNQWVKISEDRETLKGLMLPRESIETFIDVAVGGRYLPVPGLYFINGCNISLGCMQVWAVTIFGKVAYRHGVAADSPKGSHWEIIPTQPGSEVLNVSVGPRGLVWAVTWDGRCLVRLGASKKKEIGDAWGVVYPPKYDSDDKFQQVAVGIDAVWAVTRSGKVFFRKGIRTDLTSSVDKINAIGTEWVEKVGLTSLSVTCGLEGQVWAIGLHDRLVYHRTAVTKENPGGNTWKSIVLTEVNLEAEPSTGPSVTGQSSIRDELEALRLENAKLEEEKICAICLERPKCFVFDCGHMTCGECKRQLTQCHLCRIPIGRAIKIF